MTKVRPHVRMSFFQCRSRIASSRRSCTSGSVASISEIDRIVPVYTPHEPTLRIFFSRPLTWRRGRGREKAREGERR